MSLKMYCRIFYLQILFVLTSTMTTMMMITIKEVDEELEDNDDGEDVDNKGDSWL